MYIYISHIYIYHIYIYISYNIYIHTYISKSIPSNSMISQIEIAMWVTSMCRGLTVPPSWPWSQTPLSWGCPGDDPILRSGLHIDIGLIMIYIII